MEEKKVTKISLSTFFLILAIIIIILMGIFIYKLYNEKTIETEKSTELQKQVNNLNGTVSDLQEKIDSISEITANTTKNNNSNSTNVAESQNSNNKTSSTNTSTEITTLNGEYHCNEEYESFTYSFSGNTVKFSALHTTYGTYKIVDNKVKITYTKAEDPDGNDMKEFPDGQTDELTILDENTLINNNGTKYIKN